jgi:hypothetical protein
MKTLITLKMYCVCKELSVDEEKQYSKERSCCVDVRATVFNFSWGIFG